MNKRQENNLKILKHLFEVIIDEPDLRFIQILWALGIIDRENDSLDIKDRFHEEPEITLKKMEVMLDEKLREITKKG